MSTSFQHAPDASGTGEGSTTVQSADDSPSLHDSEPATDTGGPTTSTLIREVAAVASFGAAALHFAVAPEHFATKTIMGVFFVGAASFQLITAALLGANRFVRPVLGLTMFGNLIVLGTWAAHHTVGLPTSLVGDHFHPTGWPDITAGVFEAIAVFSAAVGLATPTIGGKLSARVIRPTIAGLTAVSMSLIGLALYYGSAEDAAHSTADAAVGTAGHSHSHSGSATNISPLSTEQFFQLNNEIGQAREIWSRYPTVQAAKAAGYLPAGPYAPGAGKHLINLGVASQTTFDIEKPMAMLFSADGDQARPVGLMYLVQGEQPPEGFIGSQDVWHQHTHACYKEAKGVIEVPFRVDGDVSQEQCDSVAGTYVELTGWMVHVWLNPAFNSEDGLFAHDNHSLVCPPGTDGSADNSQGCVPV